MEEPIPFGANCCINCELKFKSQDKNWQLKDDSRENRSENKKTEKKEKPAQSRWRLSGGWRLETVPASTIYYFLMI